MFSDPQKSDRATNVECSGFSDVQLIVWAKFFIMLSWISQASDYNAYQSIFHNDMKPYDSAHIDWGLALLPSSMYKQVFPKSFKKSCYTFPMD